MAEFELSGADGRRSRLIVRTGLEGELREILAAGDGSSLYVLHDPAVEGLARKIATALGARAVFAARRGEEAKSMAELERLAGLLVTEGADRKARLLVIGGGAVLDLGALLAGLYHRGIAVALLPTTLLAAVDAAIGGKSAIDVGATKNVLGLFRQPDQVLADPLWLADLPDHDFRQGLAELIKMAAILDEEVFHHLEGVIDDLLARRLSAVEQAIEAAMAMKTRVCAVDEREAGPRMFLNFGHTLGHAIESVSGYRVAHGDAVAMGMMGELEMTGCEAARIEALLASAGLPTALPEGLRDLDRLWAAMQQDKKNRGGRVRVAIAPAIGRGEIRELERSDLERLR